MSRQSRRTGAREERAAAAALPGAVKVSRSGYSGPDLKWRDRWVEVKYRKDGFKFDYGCLDGDASILVKRAARRGRLVTMSEETLLDLLEEAAGNA